MPAARPAEQAQRKHLQEMGVPPEIEDFAHAILDCAECARVLSLLASRP